MLLRSRSKYLRRYSNVILTTLLKISAVGDVFLSQKFCSCTYSFVHVQPKNSHNVLYRIKKNGFVAVVFKRMTSDVTILDHPFYDSRRFFFTLFLDKQVHVFNP